MTHILNITLIYGVLLILAKRSRYVWIGNLLSPPFTSDMCSDACLTIRCGTPMCTRMFRITVTHSDFVEATKCRIRMGGLHSWNVEMHIACRSSVWFDCWIGVFYGGFRKNLWISLCYVVFWLM